MLRKAKGRALAIARTPRSRGNSSGCRGGEGQAPEHHHHYEKTHAQHHWWDWYAPYLHARENGSGPEEAAAAADRHMEALPR